MLLSIITINYKTPELTLDAVASVYQQFQKEFEKDEIEYLIVDNKSGDDSAEKIAQEIKKAHYKNVSLLENNENAGFGRGNNFAEEKAKGKYLLFLNSDTKTMDRGFLNMVKFLDDHQKVGIIGGQMRNFDGSPQLSASKFYTLGNLFVLLIGGERWGFLKKSPKKIMHVDWVTGGCMMVRKDMFDAIGKFDKNIFMYGEDMELCYRAQKMHYQTYFYPFVNVLHKSQGSSNREFAIISIYKGIRYFYKKHLPPWQYGIANSLLCLKSLILVIIGKVTGNTYLSQTYEKAFGIY